MTHVVRNIFVAVTLRIYDEFENMVSNAIDPLTKNCEYEYNFLLPSII